MTNIQFNIPSESENLSGIYIIKSEISHKFYIGSTNLFKLRFQQHLCDLRKNKHSSRHLQFFFNKYPNSLSFSILEICNKDLILVREQHYLDTMNPFSNNGFNTAKIAGSNKGFKHTDECKARMSKNRKGVKYPEYLKEERRLTWLGRKHKPESIEKMKAAQANKTYTKEQRLNMSLAHIGHKQSQKTKDKRAAKMLGHKFNGHIVLDLQTGIFYDSIKCAAIANNIIHSTLHRRLKRKASTKFIIV